MSQGPQNVLVTGGARRIGRAIAEGLGALGYGVALHCNRSVEEGNAAADAIRHAGGRAAAVTADLSDPAAAEHLVAQAREAVGDISIVVHSASVFESDTFETFSWETWDLHFALHLKAPVALTRALAAGLRNGAEGLMVNIIDQRVWRLTPTNFSYTLSKAALWTATQTMAQALGPRVRVNAIGPGPSLPSPRQEPSDFAAQVASLILRRGPDLSEFAETVDYLWKARSVTGQMIALDGGQHLAWETPDVAGVPE